MDVLADAAMIEAMDVSATDIGGMAAGASESDSEVRFRTSPLRREVSYHGVIIRRSALSHEEVSYHGVIM
jgi:hypothetical protein